MKSKVHFILATGRVADMRMRGIGAATVAILAAVLTVGPTWATEDEARDLRKEIEALRADLARIEKQTGNADSIKELARRIDLLAAELEKARTAEASAAAEPDATAGVPGLGPAASKVYRTSKGVSLGGYGEILYQNFGDRSQDDSPSGRSDTIDLLRNVLYVGYKFGDRILFNSELEFEHATTGEGAEEKGEISVEFAYLDFRPSRRVGVRAGLLLIPVGFINELHEAPIFNGARRPEAERTILPATWRENGVGLFGDAGPLTWRAYAVASLSSEGFEGAGIREGRQGGSNSLAQSFAFSARADYTGLPGLLAGASIFTGNTGQSAALSGRITLFDVHAQYERRGLQLRALYAGTRIADGALINEQNGLSGDESVGERQHGWYLEAAYDLMTLRPRGEWAVTPFVRYEQLDTQDRVPAGFAKDTSNDRSILTLGVGVKPVSKVVLKADLQRWRNTARTGVNQFNLAVGYLF
jgi:hypothetical protein